MSNLRFKAMGEALTRPTIQYTNPEGKISDFFGINVFDQQKMRRYLSNEAYESVATAIEEGRRIDRKIAGQVAAGMGRDHKIVAVDGDVFDQGLLVNDPVGQPRPGVNQGLRQSGCIHRDGLVHGNGCRRTIVKDEQDMRQQAMTAGQV